MSDPLNAKENYQSFIRNWNTKSVNQSKIIIDQPKTFENPEPVDVKPVITEYWKTSHKLYKTKRQAEKTGSNSSLHSNGKKVKIF